jgi:hypothetical protein
MIPLAPSFHALIITGILLLSVFILLIRNYKEIMTLKLYDKIVLLCMISVAIGSHGLIHLGVEQNYGFNPYKWF